METYSESVGRRIRESRDEAGLTQAELGERCEIRPNNIARYERGEVNMSLELATRIARALEVRLDWMADGTGEASIV